MAYNPFLPRKVNRALKKAAVSHPQALASEVTSLWAETARLWVDASMTIAWRMPLLMRPDDMSSAAIQERIMMVAEKVEAAGQAQIAAGMAATRMLALAAKGTSPGETVRQASRSVRAVMKPAAAKARNNANRLTQKARERTKPT